MNTIFIFALSLLLAVAGLIISLRIVQWFVTAICGILSAAIDFFREIKDATEAVSKRLWYLARFICKFSAMVRLRLRARVHGMLCVLSPRICNALTKISWMLSRASYNVYLKYRQHNHMVIPGTMSADCRIIP